MEGVRHFLGSWFNTKESEESKESEENEKVEMETQQVNSEAQETGMEALTNIEKTDTSEVCKFYLENKCRFGDQCRNRHEGEPIEKPVKKDNLEKKTLDKDKERSKKKPPMKTAADVIKRIQWDPMIPKVK